MRDDDISALADIARRYGASRRHPGNSWFSGEIVRRLIRRPIATSFMVLGLFLAVLFPVRSDGNVAQNVTVVPVDPAPPSASTGPTGMQPPRANAKAARADPARQAPAHATGSRTSPPRHTASATASRAAANPARSATRGSGSSAAPVAGGSGDSGDSGDYGDSGGSGGSGRHPGDTGVPSGTALTVHQGDLVITKAGASYDALDIHGFVVVEAPDVTIRRSIIRGGLATGAKALVSDTDPAGRGFVIEDSELVPDHPSVFLDGLAGADYTAARLDIHGTVDGAKVFGDHVRITSSWLHDLRYYDHDPAQNGGPTHNDGVQVLSGDDIDLVGNRIDVTAQENSGLQVTQDHGATTNLHFEDNQVDGGTCSVKLSDKGGGELGPITLRANTFGRGTGIAGCAVLATHATRLTASDNRWRDTGAPVTPVVYG